MGMNYNIYVDYNDNGVFTDPGELVLQMGQMIAGTISGSFTIPGTAPPGTHRMRIRAEIFDELFGGGYPQGPCTQLQYGETEDYGLTVTVPCIQPTIQATIGNYTNNNSGDNITVNWTRGNGDNVMIVGRLTSASLSNPVSGTSYTADINFGGGTQIGTGNFVVYNGAGTSVNVAGLTPGASYTFTCYEFNTADACYKTPGSAMAVIAGLYCVPPQSARNNYGRFISNVTTTAGINNFTNNTGAETASYGNYSSSKIALQTQGSIINIFATNTLNGMYYIVYVDYNDNGVFSDLGELVLQMENSAGGTVAKSFTIPDNAPLGTHRMRVRADDGSFYLPRNNTCTQLDMGETEDYGLTIIASTGDYCLPGVSNLYNLGRHISNVTTTGGLTNFTNATGIEPSSYGNYSSTKITSQAQNSPISISATCPTIGMYYNVYVDYNDNKVFTDPGELVLQMEQIYGGTISGSFTIPADAPLGSHRMRVRGESSAVRRYPTSPCNPMEYGETEDYGITVIGGCTPPTTQAAIGSYTNNTLEASGITVNWTRGNGSSVVVVGRAIGSVLTDPSSGTPYTANTIFGSGAEIGVGNFVVYNGTGTSVTVNGLSSGTSYTFTCYEYESTAICYKNPGSALAVVPGLFCKPPKTLWYNGMYISNVSTAGGVINFTKTTGRETASYGNYSSTQIASQIRSSSITLFATSNVDGTVYNVYVDYNDNGVFTDPGELVLQMVTASPGTVSGIFTIPTDAPLGSHRMRVRSESYYAGYPTGPCTQLQYGETEDYGLTVTTACTSPPTATITAGGSTTFCQGENVMLTSNPGASYLWSTGATTQSITVSSAGDYTVNVTNADGCSATSAATTVTVNQPQTWYLDADNDGHYVSSQQACTSPGTGYNTTATISGDCDDNDTSKWQSALLYADADGDGYTVGSATPVCYGSTIPAGYKTTSLGTDCNDADATKWQSALLYADADGDGYTVGSATSVCYGSTIPTGYKTTFLGTDCNDADATKWQSALLYADADGDGYTIGSATSVCYGTTIPAGYKTTSLGTDCNDADATKWQSALLFVDADGDGYTVGSATSVCYGSTIPAGYKTTSLGTDCNDADATKWQSALLFVDADGDGYTIGSATSVCYGSTIPAGYKTTSLGTDCNDADATKWQSALLFVDTDGDGYTIGSATSVCYGSTIPAGYKTSTLGADCNDNNPGVHPGAVEVCGNGIDNNCNGQVDENCSTCTNATGLSTTNITSGSATLNWVASVNPVAWLVQYKKTDRGAKWKDVLLSGSARSVVISALSSKQTYNWQIRAKCGKTWTSYSATMSFKTLAGAALARGINETTKAEENMDAIATIKLHPNPTSGRFMLELRIAERNSLKAQIQLIDMIGRTVYSENTSINNGMLQKQINLSSNLAHGIYVVRIMVNDKIFRAQLVYAK